MKRLIASIKKEFLLITRDIAGLGLVFLMPAILVLVMTLIQDASFRKLDETRITLLYFDDDRDTLGRQVKQGLMDAKYFDVISSLAGQELDENAVLDQVAKGRFQIGIVIREGSTEAIRLRGQHIARQTLMGSESGIETDTLSKARIIIYYDPAMKNSFRLTVRNALENFTSKIEAGIMYSALADELAQYLPEPPVVSDGAGSSIAYEEIYARDAYTDIIPNSVQHNVPAWTIFAMFFIIIPLTGNLIRERESGLATRLKVMPVNPFTVLSAKVVIYIMVGLLQFTLMILMGIYILPLFDLPALVLGNEPAALFLMALATTLAATGYSILVGTVARTHDQAAVFGMVSVIILAAIGGIWVPVFMMPNLMQAASIISPLNWSLDGFYDILLRGYGIPGIFSNFTALAGFFAISLSIAILINNSKQKT